MKALSRATSAARFALVVLSTGVAASCSRDEPKATAMTPTPGIFAAPPKTAAPPARPDASPPAREPLPRGAVNLKLRMTRSDVEEELGELRCHDNPQGIEVCNETRERTGAYRDLEVYFHRDRVVSLAYNTPPPKDVWEYLDKLMRQYGKPSLSGLIDRDKQGRLHEIYGWKDEETLLSVRFVWVEEPPDPRQLSATAVTVWDRKAYDDWERESQKKDVEPTPTANAAETVAPELT